MSRLIAISLLALTTAMLAGCAGLTLTPQQRAERAAGVPEYVQVQTRHNTPGRF